MWRLRPSGQKFSDVGLNEVKRLPIHLRVLALWGNKNQSEAAIKAAIETHVMTEAGGNYIAEARDWYKQNTMDPKTRDDVGKLIQENDPLLRR